MPVSEAPTKAHSKVLLGVRQETVLSWVGATGDADPSVEVAAALARHWGGKCHVVAGLDVTREPGTLAPQAPLTPEVIGRAEKRLAELYGDSVHTMVLPGHGVHEVRRYARIHNVGLVVMGEQALAVERSYGEAFVDEAPCTVMIIVPPAPASRSARSVRPDQQR